MDQRAALASPWAASAAGNLIPFALVGVAAVGLVIEASEQSTDDLRGVLLVGAGAAAGALAAAAYGRLEHDPERVARARIGAWSVIRLFLAFEMVRYGAAKIVGMQFYPRYYQLDTRPLDMHPMALAWTFFGKRYGYQAAAGVVEIGSASLLCFRRTATFGACLLLTVLTNVVILDFAYDVPVKLFASVYLVMTLYVLSIDARRLWAFFLGEGPVPARAYLVSRRGGRGLHALLVVLVLGLPAADIVHKAFQRRVFHPEALEGMWRVDRAAGVDDVLPEVPTWDKVYFEKGDRGSVRAGGRRFDFGAEVDLAAHTLRLSKLGGEASRSLAGTYALHDRALRFEGSRDGRPFSVDLTREFPR